MGGGRRVALDDAALRGVAVVLGGQHHGGLVRLRVLVVEVDHAAAAVRHRRHTGETKYPRMSHESVREKQDIKKKKKKKRRGRVGVTN